MSDEKIRRARAALAAFERRIIDLALPAPVPKALAELADALRDLLRDLLPDPLYDVWEITSKSGCREEHKALATGMTKEDAQNYIAHIDPAGRRHLYTREKS